MERPDGCLSRTLPVNRQAMLPILSAAPKTLSHDPIRTVRSSNEKNFGFEIATLPKSIGSRRDQGQANRAPPQRLPTICIRRRSPLMVRNVRLWRKPVEPRADGPRADGFSRNVMPCTFSQFDDDPKTARAATAPSGYLHTPPQPAHGAERPPLEEAGRTTSGRCFPKRHASDHSTPYLQHSSPSRSPKVARRPCLALNLRPLLLFGF